MFWRRHRRLQDMSERQVKREIKRVLKQAHFITWSNRHYDDEWDFRPNHTKPDRSD